MPFLRGNWAGYLTTGIVAFTSGITIYLIISDSARRSEIRRRKNLLATSTDDITTPLEKAQHKYGVLRIGGRFVNPFDEYLSWLIAVLIVDGVNKVLGNGLCGKYSLCLRLILLDYRAIER
jgi:hypothetical protein